jgi:hypothetical protein
VDIVLLGITVAVLGPAFFFLLISQQLKTGKAKLSGTPTFDRQRQPVDFWITIVVECVASIGFLVVGAAIILGGLMPRPPQTRALGEPMSPKVEGLIVPVPGKAGPEPK